MNTYNKLSNWGKILLFILLLLSLVIIFKSVKQPKKEGFEQQDSFLFKTGTDIYDSFYSEIYDYLVYNQIKDNYEIGQIVNKTTPSTESVILDVGSGTGHHVKQLSEKGLTVIGVDISPSMISKAKENYPKLNFVQGDVNNAALFKPNSYTHILCLYFTLYYIKDKIHFFNNCMEWLMPGGYLVIHVVDVDDFDPILPVANPLYIVSPQKYAKKRITNSKVTFEDYIYTANFELDKSKNIGLFKEKFKFKDSNKIRKQEHILYMEPADVILTEAQECGFIIQGKVDMVKCAYENQYLYILTKPA